MKPRHRHRRRDGRARPTARLRPDRSRVHAESFSDERAYDPALAELSNADKLAYFNRRWPGWRRMRSAALGHLLQRRQHLAQINTRSEHTQFFRTTDAQVTAVLAHDRLKWEVQAEQSAQQQRRPGPAGAAR
jgi:hypothetical protein